MDHNINVLCRIIAVGRILGIDSFGILMQRMKQFQRKTKHNRSDGLIMHYQYCHRSEYKNKPILSSLLISIAITVCYGM